MARLRERGRDGCLAGIQVQQLFCSNNTTIPEHQLKELNMKIDIALQVQYLRDFLYTRITTGVAVGDLKNAYIQITSVFFVFLEILNILIKLEGVFGEIAVPREVRC